MLAVLSELQTTACMRHISEYVLGKHRGPYCEGYELQAEHGQLWSLKRVRQWSSCKLCGANLGASWKPSGVSWRSFWSFRSSQGPCQRFQPSRGGFRRSCRFWHGYLKRLRPAADPLFRPSKAFKRPLLLDGVVQNSPNLETFFFITRPPSRIMTNPRRRVGSFLENMNLEPQLGPITFQNSKIVIFGGYSLLGFSEWVNFSVIFEI